MNDPALSHVFRQGLWDNNPGLVQLLGLCPLLAVSNTAVNALALGAATLAVLVVSNLTVSMCRRWLVKEIRIIFYVLVIATAVSVVDMLMAAYLFSVHQRLGIFVPLIVTNCAIIGRAEAFASRHAPLPSLVDAVATGIGFALALFALGALREAIGQGTLFADAALLFGAGAAGWRIEIGDGFLLAALPPGAFLALALLVAARNALDARAGARRAAAQPA